MTDRFGINRKVEICVSTYVSLDVSRTRVMITMFK